MNTKTLYRTEDDKMLGGVCGGLGKYFNVDPTLIRLIFVLIFFGYGSGLMIYALLWIIMPNEAMLQSRARTGEQTPPPAENNDEVLSGEVVE